MSVTEVTRAIDFTRYDATLPVGWQQDTPSDIVSYLNAMVDRDSLWRVAAAGGGLVYDGKVPPSSYHGLFHLRATAPDLFGDALVEGTFYNTDSSTDSWVFARLNPASKTGAYARAASGVLFLGYLANNAASEPVLTQTTCTLSNSTRYRIILRVRGSGVARAWVVPDSAPTGTAVASVTATDAVHIPTTGVVGLGLYAATNFLRFRLAAPGSDSFIAGWIDARVTGSSVALEMMFAEGFDGTETVAWYASDTSGFTPGAGTLLAGVTGYAPTWASGLSPGAVKYVQAKITQGINTARSNEVAVVGKYTAVGIGIAADSWYALTTTPDSNYTNDKPSVPLERNLQGMLPLHGVFVNNRSVSGTTVAVWNSTYLAPSITAWLLLGVQYIYARFGLNDMIVPRTAAQFKSDYQTFIATCVAAGLKVIIAHAPYFVGGSQSGRASSDRTTIQLYNAAVDSLIDNVNVFAGSRATFPCFADASDWFLYDQLHRNEIGALKLAAMDARAIADVVDPTAGGTIGASATNANNLPRRRRRLVMPGNRIR